LLIAAGLLAPIVLVTAILKSREKKRQMRLAATREPVDVDGFVSLMVAQGADALAARFLWDEVQSYYHPPLTPHPDDRLSSEFNVDDDDIDDMIERYARKVGARVRAWNGPTDPTLAQFAIGLEAMTAAP
jgi:hypothetical protein